VSGVPSSPASGSAAAAIRPGRYQPPERTGSHLIAIDTDPGDACGPLVLAAQRGDTAAFEELYRRFGRFVHAILLARVGEAAADLSQDVFLQAWTRIRTLREPAAFPGWIAAIARRRAIDYQRAYKDERELDDPVAVSARPDLRVEALQAIEAITALPEAYREPLLLRLVEGCSGAEIAAMTGLTPESVRVNLHRGFKMLRDRLK
jgi:RNA polymerase sigma-70 factor (ECF subfamily)